MSYQFLPLTDEQLDSFDLVKNGVYNFEVAKATRKTSKSGNPMAELQLRIWDKEGKVHLVFDYLVFSTVNLNIRKVKHFCDSVGLSLEYRRGELPEEMTGLSGKVEIGQQESQSKPTGGYYAAKNVVIDYLMADKVATQYDGMKPLPEKKDEFLDDPIPF
jgi:hypothetical protein